ncbi:hypothetical protein GOZ93_00890 [Agrobacterium vitis]|uniref:hypothetical protein n=1 Tax=Agrobacterium vitis TaxID=373 RepID=UPI0012E80DA7|nr:hypothetical protein [Agrobacterium vitis]MUZ80794.1 hypothetical protein [Agrobacterium vitis]
MAQPYPISRETREEAIFLGDGGSSYGPFGLKIFDSADVLVCTKATGETVWTEQAVTVTKVSDEPFDEFSIDFASDVPNTTKIKVIGARVHERTAGLTQGVQLNSDALEKELTKQGIILQELARDRDRSIKMDFDAGGQGYKVSAGLAVGATLMLALGGVLVAGPNASDIQAAQGYAVAAQGYMTQAQAHAADADGFAVAAAASATTAAGYAASINPAQFAIKNNLPINVVSYGADNTGAVSSSAAFAAAYAACAAGGDIEVPAGSYTFVTGISGTKSVNWVIRGDLALTAYNWSDILPGNVVNVGRRDMRNGVASSIFRRDEARSLGLVTTSSVDFHSLDIVDDAQVSGGGRKQGFVVYHRAKAGATGIIQTLCGQMIIEGQPGVLAGGGHFVALQGGAYANVSSVNSDALFGLNTYAEIKANVTGYNNVTGGEFNTVINTGGAAAIRTGIQIPAGGQVRGTSLDAAIAVGNLSDSGNPLWKYGLAFVSNYGAHALASDSTAIYFDTQSITHVIDASLVTVSGALIKGKTTSLTETELYLGAAASGYALLGLANATQTNAGFALRTKGNGGYLLQGGSSNTLVQINGNSSAVNSLLLSGANTGAAPSVAVQGSDTNINLSLVTKGTGLLSITTGVALGTTSAGATRYFPAVYNGTSVNILCTLA